MSMGLVVSQHCLHLRGRWDSSFQLDRSFLIPSSSSFNFSGELAKDMCILPRARALNWLLGISQLEKGQCHNPFQRFIWGVGCRWLLGDVLLNHFCCSCSFSPRGFAILMPLLFFISGTAVLSSCSYPLQEDIFLICQLGLSSYGIFQVPHLI